MKNVHMGIILMPLDNIHCGINILLAVKHHRNVMKNVHTSIRPILMPLKMYDPVVTMYNA